MLVLSHHKCATTWLSGYLDAFTLANHLSFAVTHRSADCPQADVMCLINSEYRFAAQFPIPKLHIIRNPLDLIVSAYHSHQRTHALDGWPQLERQRAVLEGCSREAGMALTLAFLERDDFHDWAVGPLHALRQWEFSDPEMETLRMEDAVVDGGARIGHWLQQHLPAAQIPDPSAFGFDRLSGRAVGTVDDSSHYRSGRHGQWREELPLPVIAYVRAHYARILEMYYPECL